MIWLLRHGDAEEAADDDSRRLTESGQRQAVAAGRAIASLGIKLDACLASPKVRARDMARVVGRELGVEVEEAEGLRDGGFHLLDLAVGRGETLLVGHEPALSQAVLAATGARVKLRKGGLAGVDEETLILLLGPRELEAIAAGNQPGHG
jgi:phosphohistidine phosphatase